MILSLVSADFATFVSSVNRVRWFRARAESKRWEEEVFILREEFKRAARAFKFLSEAWRNAGDAYAESSRGRLAYSRERSQMYSKMEAACKAEYSSVEGRDLDEA